jgi:16S rRNA (guanine1207-N2)-methyltransferase
MYKEAKEHLVSGGQFYFVIRKAQGASSASQYVKEVFGNITLLARSKGYHIYKAMNE